MLKNKIALVTGASKGIGVYICKSLAKEGFKIAAVARSDIGLKKTSEKIKKDGGKIEIFPYDLTNTKGIPLLIENIITKIGTPNILVNNAGIEKYSEFKNYSENEISSVFNTNLISPIILTKEILSKMSPDGGAIVNIASLAGKKGVAFNSLYSATKAGLIMWSDAMRQELKDTDVSFSVICPGFISDTGMFAESNLKAPSLLGTSKPQNVADAVIRAINSKYGKEIIVNKGPIKPLLAIGQLFPIIGDKLVELFGVKKLNKKRIVK